MRTVTARIILWHILCSGSNSPISALKKYFQNKLNFIVQYQYLLAVWTTVCIFPETRKTIDKTTCNPGSTETTEDSPGPATAGDGGVYSCRNLIN